MSKAPKLVLVALSLFLLIGPELAHIGCSRRLLLRGNQVDVQVSNNLAQISIVLREAVGSGDRFPSSLTELRPTVNSNLFVCPSTGGQPGRMNEIEQWSDYVYVGNLIYLGLQNVALVISPPENHNQEHGFVLFTDGHISRLAPDEVRELIDDPFSMDRTTSRDFLTPERKLAKVNVPKRLKSYYHSPKKLGSELEH